MMTSLDIDDADMNLDVITDSSMIPCLLCRKDLAAVPDEHEKHLKLEHKVKFKLSWIIKKTWKESVKTWEELVNSLYSSSNVKEETLIEDDSIERTKVEPGISEENDQDLDEQYFSASEFLAKKKYEQNLEKQKYKPYKCSFCEKSFKTKSYVEVHEKKHSVESVIMHNDEQMSIEENEQNVDRKQYKPYKCSFCEKSFKTKSYVEVHEKKHSGESVIVDNAEQKSIVENEQNLERKQCSFCEKSFKTKSYVEVHEKKHSGESVIKKTYQCSLCTRAFNTKHYVKTHEKKEHNYKRKSLKPYPCSFCENRFKSKYYVEIHEKKHAGEPLVNRDDEQNNLFDKDHNISNSNMCSFEGCEQKCLTRDDLKAHLKTHKKRKHKCSICGKGFKTKVYVLIHEKKNHNYQCSVCEEAFSSKRFVRVHERKKHSHGEIKSWNETDEKKPIDEFEENANMLETDENKRTDEFEENANVAKTWGWPS